MLACLLAWTMRERGGERSCSRTLGMVYDEKKKKKKGGNNALNLLLCWNCNLQSQVSRCLTLAFLLSFEVQPSLV